VFPLIIRLLKVFTLTAKHAGQIKRVRSKNLPNGKALITQIKKDWARASLDNLGVRVKTTGASVSERPILFVGNHVSYLDIPLVMATAPVSFVAKFELSRWPIIGDACRAVGTVFVKRESVESRKLAVQKIGDACLEDGQSICIFPSGTTTVKEDKPWRKGAFEIAKLRGLQIQCFRIKYCPQEIAAFVGDDAFVPHLWRLLKEGSVSAEIEFSHPFTVDVPDEDCSKWQHWCKEILNKD
jgi:lyso-ornithine lipid O-acyltransferase